MAQNRIRIGIFFGGASREREISFAGGRTVYDNLDKTLFEPVPLFVDSFNNLILLDWQYIYKGTIRDFYPPADLVGDSPFQHYIENAPNGHDPAFQQACIDRVGRRVRLEELPQLIDFAFLCLHGQWGEDGSIQGLLQWLQIPYSGAGIFGSAFGFDKGKQKELSSKLDLKTPDFWILKFQRLLYYFSKEYKEYDTDFTLTEFLVEDLEYLVDFDNWENIYYPLVLKHPTQGSSVGVHIIKNREECIEKILKAFFIEVIEPKVWQSFTQNQKIQFIQQLIDIRSSIGIPLWATYDFDEKTLINEPNVLLDYLNKIEKTCYLLAIDYPETLLVEDFIEGREFSHIVLDNNLGLPPTEIIKSKDFFDYQSKYLPGIVKKKTPMDGTGKELYEIRNSTAHLKRSFFMDVYARIDGILTADGTIYLNDPNTTSGMLPSSFFFHQAAEVGFSPKDFITHIIKLSLDAREKENVARVRAQTLRGNLTALQTALQNEKQTKQKIGVILGGYTFERHISAESGRNIFEKLNSSAEFEPIPLFLLHNRYLDECIGWGGEGKLPNPWPQEGYSLWKIPINILLKDNADDIAQKIVQYIKTPLSDRPYNITNVSENEAKRSDRNPEYISFDHLPSLIDFAFIALHGRPGEDGDLQTVLERLNIPYNGSGPESSRITIDKFATTELLMQNGLKAAAHFRLQKADWAQNPTKCFEKLESVLAYPLIGKPVDDGCSSAVKKIPNRAALEIYLEMLFRETENAHSLELRKRLSVGEKEEFPMKTEALLETFVQAGAGEKLIEVTVGMLTHREADGSLRYEVFEPSETIADGGILSLEEKFLAGEGQNITPARFSPVAEEQKRISAAVRLEIERAARLLNIEGYCRIDAFVKLREQDVEVWFIEVNSLPGMTPATVIFHQAALAGYKPLEFIAKIIAFGQQKAQMK